jgi:hypothetical protein
VTPIQQKHGREVCLPLSANQRELLRVGLLPIIICLSRVRSGRSPNAEIPITFGDVVPGSYDSSLAAHILETWKTLYPRFSQHGRTRAKMDLVDLSACILGVRAVARSLRHGHVQLDCKRPLFEIIRPLD